MEIRKNKSLESILKSAKELFWKFGIKRVTVEEICKEAGVSKMTFYRLFENKEDVACIVLERVFKEAKDKYRSIMDSGEPYPEKIKKVIVMKYESSNDISGELVKDIYQNNHPDIAEFMNKSQQELMEEIINDFRIAKEKGYLRQDVNIQFLMHILQILREKMLDESFVSMYNNTQDAIMELTNFFFYGILSENEKARD